MTSKTKPTSGWRTILRVLLKALVLFELCNILFVFSGLVDILGRFSLYGTLFPYQERLTLVQEPKRFFEVGIHNVPATFSRHVISRPKQVNEFRVVLLGDSATRGHGLTAEQTYAGQLNALNLQTADGRHVITYNLGLAQNSAIKDLLLLDYARQYDIDMAIWFTTLLTMHPQQMMEHPLLDRNRDLARALIMRENLPLPLPAELTFFERTLIGQRVDLSEMLQLQTYGFAGNAIAIPEVPERDEDLDVFRRRDEWQGLQEGHILQEADLGLSVIEAGRKYIPLIVVNEPVYITSGPNSDVSYNSAYPRWIYDQYLILIEDYAADHGWHYLDIWDAVPAESFTNSVFHMNPEGATMVAMRVAEALRPLLAEF